MKISKPQRLQLKKLKLIAITGSWGVNILNRHCCWGDFLNDLLQKNPPTHLLNQYARNNLQ